MYRGLRDDNMRHVRFRGAKKSLIATQRTWPTIPKNLQNVKSMLKDKNSKSRLTENLKVERLHVTVWKQA